MEATGLPDPTVPAEGVPTPTVPTFDHEPGQLHSPEEVSNLAAEFAKMRAEVAAFRAEMAKAQPRTVQIAAVAENEEQRLAARLAEVAEHPFYCHGCGRLYDYPQKCLGSRAAPHPAIEVVSTDELKAGDPANHTAAPPSTTEALQEAATA